MPETPTRLWDDELQEAWLPPEDLTVSQWAERYRLIVSKDAAEPGRWHNDRTPWLVEPMDMMGNETVQEVVLLKAARVGGTECARNATGYWIDHDPGPCLWVYPTEQSTREQFRNEIIPLLHEVPRLARHIPEHDKRALKVNELNLIPCTMYAGWAGSPQTLASKTIRRGVADEVDKFPPFSGREADPLNLLRRRLTTFGSRGKMVVTSTPTTTSGAIWVAFNSCLDKRHYHIPCPCCGEFQRVEWEQVRWRGYDEDVQGEDRLRIAAEVETTGDAWIVCKFCAHEITERERVAAIANGEWVSEGFERGQHPLSTSVGYHIPATISTLGITLGRLAGQYLRAQEQGYGAKMEFVTQALGLPFDGVLATAAGAVGEIAKRDRELVYGEVPLWAGIVTVGVDTQKDHYAWVARAWDSSMRSRMVAYGKAYGDEELYRVLQARWPRAGSGVGVGVSLMFIDAGGAVYDELTETTTTDRVYLFSLRDFRVVPCMGRGNIGAPFIRHKRAHQWKNGFIGQIMYVQTDHWKDVLVDLMAANQWELCNGVTDDYLTHINNGKKTENKDGEMTWGRRFKGAPIDFHDAEALSVVSARVALLGAGMFSEPTLAKSSASWVDGKDWWH